MNPFNQHTGVVVAMDRANVDTDQIIPKQFLKRIERSGFGEFLFFDWRFHDDGSLYDVRDRFEAVLVEGENRSPSSEQARTFLANAAHELLLSRPHPVMPGLP